MNNEKCCCMRCLFCAPGLVKDYSTPARPFIPGKVCTIRPPCAGHALPSTSPAYVCALYTDANGAQPLRHLLVQQIAQVADHAAADEGGDANG